MTWVCALVFGGVSVGALVAAVWHLGAEWTRLSEHRMNNQRMVDLIEVEQDMQELETRAERLARRGEGGGAAA